MTRFHPESRKELLQELGVGGLDVWPIGRDYRIWVNDDSTLYVRIWASGIAEVALRGHRSETWGPPATLHEEET